MVISWIGIKWYKDELENKNYLDLVDNSGLNWIKCFFEYILLLNTLIPISLIVTIEVVKQFQAYFINNDYLMYSMDRDKPAKVSSASLNEELG